MIDELRREQIEEVRRKILEAKRKRRKRLLIFLPVLILLLLAVFLVYQASANQHFEITHYQVKCGKVQERIRIAVLSDLHSEEYGAENRDLIEAIRGEEPDFIAMIGDMVNMDDTDFSLIRHLCRELGGIAPVYYTLGNHEGTMMYGRADSVALDEILQEEGVKMLINQTAEFKKGETSIQIAGISIEAAGYDQWARDKMEAFWEMEGCKVVLSHFPDLYYNKLKDAEFDLALAGHYHGGLIRVPGLGGLYHPQAGFLPKYSGGQYQLSHGSLVVSRGLGGHGLIPRMNNRPELVIVDID